MDLQDFDGITNVRSKDELLAKFIYPLRLMSLLRSILLLSLACLAAAHAQTVDYTKQIAPLWDSYCVDCHSADDADGEFALDTFAALMKGGEEGAAIVAGEGGRVAAGKVSRRALRSRREE
jgi:mono/diheme cytochrome c family protein